MHIVPTEREHDRRALEALVVDNADLERLEALIGQFNIFEAIGVERQELRHSDFLAFLLDPRQTHGLGEAFLRRFLQKALMANRQTGVPISPIDFDVWALDEVVVEREWRNVVDILLTDKQHGLAVIVENKIGSGEHSDQLGRYLRLVEAQYPGWTIMALYLTPEGEAPSEPAYLPINYGLVCEAVDAVAESRRPTLDPAVHALMTHYARMLRRHVVGNSEIAELCLGIYQRHKRALDLIFEHRSVQQEILREFLEGLIHATPGLILDSSSKQSIVFVPEAWETPVLRTASRRMILFEFKNAPQQLDLQLFVGPGPAEVRRQLVEMARHGGPLLTVRRPKSKEWNTIFTRPFLRANDYDGAAPDEVKARIRDQWEKFLEKDLPMIVSSMPVANVVVPAGEVAFHG